MPSFSNAEAECVLTGDIKTSARGGSVTLVEMSTAPPIVPKYDMLRPNISFFSPTCILGQLQLSD